jgi:hypothetical protein
LVWAGFIALLTGVGWDTGLLAKEDFRIKIWMSGWVWSREEVGAITVGVYQDFLSLAMSALSVLTASALLMANTFSSREPYPERAYAALAISTAGVALAWTSLTPWLVFAGLTLTILGGFISLGSRWDSNPESIIATRFVWERSFGALLAFFGACVLATSRSALLLSTSDTWLIQNEHLGSTWIGASLLVAGLFVQMQPFPLLGWVVSESELYPPLRTLLNQLFPAWAAFPILLRLEPQLVSLGLFPGFGWFAIASSILAVLTGLFQKKWRLGLGSWLAAGFSLACALLAFSGPVPAMGVLIGVSLGAMVISGAATALETGSDSSLAHKKQSFWLKFASFLGAGAGTGMFGFVSANGNLHWINQSMNLPGMTALFLFSLFLFVLLGWKLAWNVIRLQSVSDVSWWVIISLFVWIVLSLGIVWTGTVTGGVLLGDPDRVMTSLFVKFFGERPVEFPNSEDFITASSLYWGAIIFAFTTAYWTSNRSEDRWSNLASLMPRTSKFLAGGYGIDTMLGRLNFALTWFGRSAESLIDYKIWDNWIPRSMNSSLRAVSNTMSGIDFKISSNLGGALRRCVEIPAKILQLIQTGDLRWYLFFSLGSGFALLLHFLRR